MTKNNYLNLIDPEKHFLKKSLFLQARWIEDMNEKIVVKRILQGIAACYGILGVGLIVLGILFVIPSAKEAEDMGYATLLFLAVLFFLPGIFMLLAAYQNFRKFGENSIRNVSAIIAFTVYILLPRWLEPLMKNIMRFESRLTRYYVLLLILFPFIIAFIIYSILSKKLIQVTKDQNIATQSAQGDGENATSSEP